MPTDMSLDQLMPQMPSQANPNNSAVSQVTEIAGHMQDLQTNQLKQQQLQQQLDDAKYKTLTGVTSNAMNMSDPMFKLAEKQMDQRLAQTIPGYTPGTLRALRADPETQANVQAYQQGVTTGQIPVDAQHKQMINSIFASGDPTQISAALDSIGEQRKQAGAQAVAHIEAQGKVDAADIGNGPNSVKSRSLQARVGNQYDNEMKPYEQALDSVDSLKGIMADVDSGKLNDAQNVKADMEAKMASVMNKGAAATDSSRHAVEMQSIYGSMMNTLNQATGQQNGILTDKQKDQLRSESNAFGATAAKLHEDKFNTFMGRQNDPTIRQQLGQSYANYRVSKGLSVPGGMAPQAGVNTPPPAQPPLTPGQQAYADKVKAMVDPTTNQPYTQDKIMAAIQRNNVK